MGTGFDSKSEKSTLFLDNVQFVAKEAWRFVWFRVFLDLR
jgi:hypothetical protein